MCEVEGKLLTAYNGIFSKHSKVQDRQQAVDAMLKEFHGKGELKFYHGSKNKNITQLEPRAIGVRDPEEGPVVFTTNFRAIAPMFIMGLRDGDKIMNFEGTHEKTPFVIFRNRQLIIDNDNGGMVYECKPQGDDYCISLSKGWGINECASKLPVDIIDRHEVEYAIQEIADNGVDIYIAGDELFNYIEFHRVSSRVIPVAKQIIYHDRFEEFFGKIRCDVKKVAEKIKARKFIPVGRFIKDEFYTHEFIGFVAEVISTSKKRMPIDRMNVYKAEVFESEVVSDEIRQKYGRMFSEYRKLMQSVEKGEPIVVNGNVLTAEKIGINELSLLRRMIDIKRQSKIDKFVIKK